MRTTAKMSLTSWDQPTDPYNYAQLAQNWQVVDFHDHSPGRGVPVAAGGLAPGAVLSNSIAAGVIGPQHLSSAVLQDLGLNSGSSVGRGYFSNAGANTTTSTSFTALSTPDQVANVTLAAGGLILVDYHALWKVTSTFTASADIFLGSTEAVGNQATATPATTTATALVPLYTAASGNAALASSGATWTGEITTGVVLGASVPIYVAAGTYTVSVRFKVSNSSATATVQNRQLWVRTCNYE